MLSKSIVICRHGRFPRTLERHVFEKVADPRPFGRLVPAAGRGQRPAAALLTSCIGSITTRRPLSNRSSTIRPTVRAAMLFMASVLGRGTLKHSGNAHLTIGPQARRVPGARFRGWIVAVPLLPNATRTPPVVRGAALGPPRSFSTSHVSFGSWQAYPAIWPDSSRSPCFDKRIFARYTLADDPHRQRSRFGRALSPPHATFTLADGRPAWPHRKDPCSAFSSEFFRGT